MSEPETPLPSPVPVTGEREKKPPRWTIPFLRALVRTGDVRASAEDAGIDHTTAYARRRTHPEFAGLWLGALALHERWIEMQRAGEVEALCITPPHHAENGSARDPSTNSSSRNGPPRRAELREELVGSGAQLKRAGEGRWNQRKEKLFFDELAATANVKRAAKAAGVSPNAVYQRRMRDAHFKAKWAAVLETGRASIEMHLVEAANRSFEPEELDIADTSPKVSVAEAIRIVQTHGSKKQQEALPHPLDEDAAAMSPDEVEELRERLIRKLKRLRERRRREQLEEGWMLDEERDHMIPPGWVRA